MSALVIEQAVYVTPGTGGDRFRARSPGFLEDWLPTAEQLCADFGERPAGVACPAGVFAQPFGRGHVAVVQVADAGPGGALGFRLLVLSRLLYERGVGDPFVVADRFPPPWDARGELPALSWPDEPPPPRTVAQVQDVLRRPDSPVLLGGVQALVDGGRVVFERPAPDEGLIRGLWFLLPTTTRGTLWPASFAFGNALGFDAVVVPHADDEALAGYVTEEQAETYPESRYELTLQTAAEAGDQDELDGLFARRSRADTWRLALILLVVFMALTVCMKVILPPPRPPKGKGGGRPADKQTRVEPARPVGWHRA